MIIIDGFIFNDELDLLEYRLELLFPYIDFFILVESKQTFTGKPKEAYFEQWKSHPRFQKYGSKIIHILLNQLEHPEPNNQKEIWENEWYQRNCIHIGIQNIHRIQPLSEQDILIISDVDEIPNPYTQCLIKNGEVRILEMYHLELDFYYYSLNYRKKKPWKFAKIMPMKSYFTEGKGSPEECRKNHCTHHVPLGGWHLSYFCSPEHIQKKISQFSHQEYNTPTYNQLERIQECMRTGKDLFDREEEELEFIRTCKNTNLPPLFYKYLYPYFEKTI